MKFLILKIILFGAFTLSEISAEVSKELNLNEFKSIELKEKGIIVSLNKNYILDENELDRVIVKKDEEVTIIFNENTRFYEKHSGIEFEPYETKSFIVRRWFNARSFGGELEEYKLILDASSGKIEYKELPEELAETSPKEQVEPTPIEEPPINPSLLTNDTSKKAQIPQPATQVTQEVKTEKQSQQITGEPTQEKTTNWIIYALAAIILLVVLTLLKLKKKN